MDINKIINKQIFIKPKRSIRIKNNKILLFIIYDFLNNEECDRLIKISDNNFSPSTTTNPLDINFRTSSTSFLENIKNKSDKEFINNINQKICETMNIEDGYSETTQIQKYIPGQYFKPHYDGFHQNDYKKFCSTQGNRTWTFMVYLNNVDKGGQTKMSKINQNSNPIRGKALIWYNLNKNASINKYTLHSGEPPIIGNKYILNKWFRERKK